MKHFPKHMESVFHVPTQQVGRALGGCISGNLVTVRFNRGPVLSIRMSELILNEIKQCPHCGYELIPERMGACKECYEVLCPVCRECKCIST